MPVGGKPVNLTKDAALDTDPAWSPDGTQLVYSSDKDSEHLQLWIRDMKSGQQPPGHRPDDAAAGRGVVARRHAHRLLQRRRHVARRADVGARRRQRHGDQGPRLAAAAGRAGVVARRQARSRSPSIAPMTRALPRGHQPDPDDVVDRRRRTTTSGSRRMPMLSIDSRGGCGPAWSPDGTKMAAIYEGVLAVWPVSRDRRAARPAAPRDHARARTRRAGQGDSRHILYQSLDKLRIVDIETGETRTVPLDLKWTPAIPTTRIVVHAGKLRRHEERRRRAPTSTSSSTATRSSSVVPHADAQPHGGQVVDASNLTVMPGLIEFHSHLQKDFGESAGARVAGVRHHHRAQPGQHALRGGRGSRGERSGRPSGPARLRHRLPDGMAARVLQDGHRDLQRQRSSRWSCSAPRCCSTT